MIIVIKDQFPAVRVRKVGDPSGLGTGQRIRRSVSKYPKPLKAMMGQLCNRAQRPLHCKALYQILFRLAWRPHELPPLRLVPAVIRRAGPILLQPIL